jgi:hypothetical protein
MKEGYWILLQNCHLATDWLQKLEDILYSSNEIAHPDFRLWLTTTSIEKFPVYIIHIIVSSLFLLAFNSSTGNKDLDTTSNYNKRRDDYPL